MTVRQRGVAAGPVSGRPGRDVDVEVVFAERWSPESHRWSFAVDLVGG